MLLGHPEQRGTIAEGLGHQNRRAVEACQLGRPPEVVEKVSRISIMAHLGLKLREASTPTMAAPMPKTMQDVLERLATSSGS